MTMSDDESFIRAVVDGRGDDTPRLVYADWLDDRSDPRGPYLRAELAWVKSGKGEKKLRSLAVGLNKVWLARVTRPPLGVCCDAIVIRNSRPHTTAAELDAVDAKLGLKLPAEHRALLLNHNGGALAFGQPPDSEDGRHAFSEVDGFIGVASAAERAKGGWVWDVAEAGKMVQTPRRNGASTLSDYVPLTQTETDDMYLVGVRGKVTGHVVFFNDCTHEPWDPGHLDPVAKSLGALLWSIIETTPQWYKLIRNGDRAGLKAWLDAGGDPNAEHPHQNREDTTPLVAAILMTDSAMVRELVSRGAKKTPEVKRVALFLKGSAGKAVKAALAAKGRKK